MDELLQEFLVESYEGLDQLDEDFVALEEAPDDRDRLASVFRTMHTIKGTCGFLGLGTLEAVSHAAEDLLSLLRDGELRLDGAITTALLQAVDAIRSILANLEATEAEGDEKYAPLIETLKQLQAGPSEEEPVGVIDLAAESNVILFDDEPEPPPAPAQEEEPSGVILLTPPPAPKAEPPKAEPPKAEAPKAEAPKAPEPKSAKKADAKGGASVADSNVRVGVGLLDDLMNLVGELVLARNQILQHAGSFTDARLQATTQRLNLITSELQEGVMKTRMQPIGTLWSKLPRMVRDLARGCGKAVRLEMMGRDTELDRTLIEALRGPMSHLIRNAVDHGIEQPADRKAAGKLPEGTLSLRAYHESGQVIVEIKDDGGGIDAARLRDKAVKSGRMTAQQAHQLSDDEAYQLIFDAGMSTAEKVTNVSGRGVGMDVVKTNIESIGGRIELTSARNVGTTLRLRIPLTLAIVPALIAECAGQRYAIPQASLLELVHIEDKSNIEYVGTTPVYRLRGRLLPLVCMAETLGVEAAERHSFEIVVVRANEIEFGLVVDAIQDTQEIVVKPLSRMLKASGVFAGATIMGDGRVALIMDVPGLAGRARLMQEGLDRVRGPQKEQAEARQATEQVLVCGAPDDGRLAIPLSAVTRLDEARPESVERAGDFEVLQYRDGLLPVLRINDVLPERRKAPRTEPPEPTPTLPMVVFYAADMRVGLVVDSIHDVADAALHLMSGATRPGAAGVGVVGGRVAELLDVEFLLEVARQRFGSIGSTAPTDAETEVATL